MIGYPQMLFEWCSEDGPVGRWNKPYKKQKESESLKMKIQILAVMVMVMGMGMGSLQGQTLSLRIGHLLPKWDTSHGAQVRDIVGSLSASGELPEGTEIKAITADSLITTSHIGSGMTVAGWLVATAKQGESISLEQVKFIVDSSDPGRSLSKTNVFLTSSYTATSPGWRRDGSVVVSGPASQAVDRLVVGVYSKSFHVNNEEEREAARSYVNGFGDFSITITASVGAASVAKTVTIAPPAAQGRLVMRLVRSLPTLTLEGGNVMVIQRSPYPHGPWQEAGNITNTQSRTLLGVLGTEFYRLRP